MIALCFSSWLIVTVYVLDVVNLIRSSHAAHAGGISSSAMPANFWYGAVSADMCSKANLIVLEFIQIT